MPHPAMIDILHELKRCGASCADFILSMYIFIVDHCYADNHRENEAKHNVFAVTSSLEACSRFKTGSIS